MEKIGGTVWNLYCYIWSSKYEHFQLVNANAFCFAFLKLWVWVLLLINDNVCPCLFIIVFEFFLSFWCTRFVKLHIEFMVLATISISREIKYNGELQEVFYFGYCETYWQTPIYGNYCFLLFGQVGKVNDAKRFVLFHQWNLLAITSDWP